MARGIKPLTVCCLCLAVGAALVARCSAAEQGRRITVQVGSEVRSAVVHVGARGHGKLPLVLSFHGGGGSARSQIGMSGMNATADRHGFVVVYPEGTPGRLPLTSGMRTWNADVCCGRAQSENVDDVAFVRALIDRLERELPIDRSRIYATGFSNGSFLTYRLACELSDRIAAVAGVSAVATLASCRPVRPMPVLHLHGRLDPTAYFDGGTCGGGFARFLNDLLPGPFEIPVKTWQCSSVPEFVADWSRLNGCRGPVREVARSAHASCVRHERCRENAEVELCTFEDGGHTWPGGSYGPVCADPDSRACGSFMNAVGPISMEMDASELIWEFFSRQRLPGRR